jgi:hypothetical protein
MKQFDYPYKTGTNMDVPPFYNKENLAMFDQNKSPNGNDW